MVNQYSDRGRRLAWKDMSAAPYAGLPYLSKVEIARDPGSNGHAP